MFDYVIKKAAATKTSRRLSLQIVMPAKAGIHSWLLTLPRCRAAVENAVNQECQVKNIQIGAVPINVAFICTNRRRGGSLFQVGSRHKTMDSRLLLNDNFVKTKKGATRIRTGG